MRQLLLGAVLLLVAACGAYQFPGSSPSPATGTLGGRVIAIPCMPVQPAGSTCAGRPIGGLQISFTDGQTIDTTTTDASGQYSIDLNAGTYRVAFKTYMRVISGPLRVTVSPGEKVVADYVLDTGIRVPVPQA